MPRLRAAAIFFSFVLLTLVCAPTQWIALRLALPWRTRIPLFFHRTLCRLMGMRITVIGEPIAGGLMLANHSGWLDVPVLSTIRPLSFVAKREVGTWLYFGTLARLQRTIFVLREAPKKALADRDLIRRRLQDGDTLVIFPEGTSSDGNRVLRFKSALLGAAEWPLGEDAGGRSVYPQVQPVSIAYVSLHGVPMGRENRPYVAWYGDMELLPHLWGVFAIGPIDAVVEFHKPLTVGEAGGRKPLASAAERTVRAGLVRALHGQPVPLAGEAETEDDFGDGDEDIEAEAAA